MLRLGSTVLIVLLACTGAEAQDASVSLGIFDSQSDVGHVLHPGTAEYNPQTKTYTVSGSGSDIWLATDEFHFVWKKVSAQDLTLTANIAILGTSGDNHRKGVLMIRQSLDQDSAYVDAARHGDGLTSLQYRETKGANTREIESNVSGPAKLRIEKQGDRYYLWISGENGDLQFAGGSARVELQSPFYVGIGVCAHQKDSVEKVAFSNVDMTPGISHTKAEYSTVETILQSIDARSSYVSPEHLTSPGWSEDGHTLTFEAHGLREQIPFTPLKTAAPVGAPVAAQPESKFVYFVSRQGGSTQIWRKLADGSQPEPLTSDDFNHSSPHLSSDGKNLLFLSYPKNSDSITEDQELILHMMSLTDKKVKTLATFIGGPGSLGSQPWSPDSRRIVFISYQSMK